jgi:hypothetical protein
MTALPATDNAVPDGKLTGSFENAISETIMPTQQVCRIITTGQYFNDSIIGAHLPIAVIMLTWFQR